MPSTPVLDPNEVEQFGPYEVYERLGMGGMAMVHRAKKRGPEGFEQTVALKRMLAHLAEDQTFVESFVREAKVASLLVHPNIAQVYDFGRIRGIYYIAMELVGGFDVRKILRYASRSNEAIPLPVVMTILGELCDALDHAHNFIDDQGHRLDIVHRDISPSNLIVAATGHLKVIDFGIAKASSRQLHTESGKVKGKLGYMSPEAALGLSSGPVSDMFSTGVVAWELITASPLFTTRTDMETMQRIREGTIAPPSYHNPTCPPELDQLVLAALEREPRARLASAAAFRAGLDDIAQRHGIATSARAVVEWIGRFAQPSDNWPRLSERAKPPTNRDLKPPAGGDPTARIRLSARRPTDAPVNRPRTPSRPPQLRRSAEHVALATEIWGEDQALAPVPGPDFSIEDLRGLEGRGVPSTRVLGPTPLPAPAPQAIDPAMRASGAATHGSVISLPPGNSARMSNLPLAPAPRPSAPPPGTFDSRQHSQPLPAPLPSSAQLPAYPSQPHVAPGYDSQIQPAPEPARRSKLPFVILGLLMAVAGVLVAILIGRGGNEPQLAVLDRPVATPDAGATADPITAPAPGSNTTTPDPKPDPKPEPDPRPDPPHGNPQVLTEPPDAQPEADPIRKPVKPSIKKPDKPRIETTKPPKPDPDPPPVITIDKPDKPPVIPPDKPPVISPDKPVVPDKPVIPPDKPSKPARTPVVGASAVTKLSGELPVLRANAGAADLITAKVCIDDAGHVTGVTSKGPAELVGELQRALAAWRYKPYLRDGKPSPVCFPLTLKLIKR